MKTNSTKGRPATLTPEQIAAANARLDKLRAVMAYFPLLKVGTVSRAAGLPLDTFSQYLSTNSKRKRQPMPDALDKLEKVLAPHIILYDQLSGQK